MENDNVMCPQCKTGHCVSEEDRKAGDYYQLCDSCAADSLEYHCDNEEELMSLTFLPIKGDF